MRNFFLALAILALYPVAAMAQDSPKAEVFGGYSFVRLDSGVVSESANLHGWEGSVTGYITRSFGIEADFSGHYGNRDININTPELRTTLNIDTNLHTFMAGPKFTYRADRASAYIHALYGGARRGDDLSISTVPAGFAFTDSETAFAQALGGGVDIKINDRVSVRALQADYLYTNFDNSQRHNFRLSTGIVLTFGR